MKKKELIEQIRHAVHELALEAEIILYGSRSRGDALSESHQPEGNLLEPRGDRDVGDLLTYLVI